MKYYIIKDKGMSGYLSRKLCRIDSKGKFEIYNWTHGVRWEPNERVEDIFNSKDKHYDIYVPKKKEIEDVKWEVEDSAYEYSHTHVSAPIKDDNGKEHEVFIYQDYRTLDGYDAETEFEYNEIWNRDNYDYYFDKKMGLLVKKEKDSNKYYVLHVELNPVMEYDLKLKWKEPEEFEKEIQKFIKNYNFKKLEPITDFQRVLDYFNNLWLDRNQFLSLWNKKD